MPLIAIEIRSENVVEIADFCPDSFLVYSTPRGY